MRAPPAPQHIAFSRDRSNSSGASRVIAAALVGTILGGGLALPAFAQGQQAPAAAAQTGPREDLPAQAAPPTVPPSAQGTIRSVRVEGSQRLEAETVRSYAQLQPGPGL